MQIVNNLEPKNNFHEKIEKYYTDLAQNKMPFELINDIVNTITESQYETYNRFWKQYPKSRKRYSEFKLNDLEHPFTYYEIITLLKKKTPLNYQQYSKILLKMNDKEFEEFEVRKMQYETK